MPSSCVRFRRVCNSGDDVNGLIAISGLLLNLACVAHGQVAQSNSSPLFVPDIGKSSGIVVELLSGSQYTNAIHVRRYSWRSGDFISEVGAVSDAMSLSITNVYSASGRVNNKTWEFSRGALIWHSGQNTYKNTFKGRTAEEVSLLGYFSRGMEIEDFATIQVSAVGDIRGKWHSTQPIQEMLGHIEEAEKQVWKLEAWTPNRLLRFESHMYFSPTVSSVLPATIRYRQILDGEESQMIERKIGYAALDKSDEEFDPHKRYSPSRILKMENDMVSGTNRAGNPVPFASAKYPTTPNDKHWRMVVCVSAGAVIIVSLLIGRTKRTKK